MGAIYKPFGIIFGLLAGQLGKKVFNWVWTKIDDEEPPDATIKETSWGKLLVAAAIQGMIVRTVRVIVDRNGAQGWEYLTGIWPGQEHPDPDK
jgi:hypothetical protein